MKLGVMVMILVILQVTIMTFDNTVSMDAGDVGSAIPVPYNETNQTSNIFWDILANPTAWTNSDLLVYLVAFIATLAATGITILGSTAISSDTVRFSPFFMLLFGVGSVPIVNFWQVLSREVSSVACEGALSCWTGWLVPFIFIAPLTIMWFFACWTHWRTGLATS